jgi:hypothetical protein
LPGRSQLVRGGAILLVTLDDCHLDITVPHEATWYVMRSIGSRLSCVVLRGRAYIQAKRTAHLRLGRTEA